MSKTQMTDDEILQLQARAVATGDHALLCDTYEAMGFGRRVPVLPTEDQVAAARRRLAARAR